MRDPGRLHRTPPKTRENPDAGWCDVDVDGDRDLAEVRFFNGQAHVYLNRSGVLDSAPSWTFVSPRVGTAIGDINGDSLPDHVVGNSGDTSLWAVYNTGTPPLFIDGSSNGTEAWSVTGP